MTSATVAAFRVTALGCIILVCAACAHSGARPASGSESSPSPDAYPGTLVDPAAMGPDFMWRQSVHATYVHPEHGEQTASFEVIVQKRDNALTVLGMTPFGARAFVIEQRGQTIELQRFVDEPLQVPPRFILIDIHRTFFGPSGDTSQPAPSAAPSDGAREVLLDGERLTERYHEGRLVERRFERLDGEPAGQIVIDYGEGAGPTPPPVVTLDNAWFGYHLVITTLETTLL